VLDGRRWAKRKEVVTDHKEQRIAKIAKSSTGYAVKEAERKQDPRRGRRGIIPPAIEADRVEMQDCHRG